MILRNYWIAFKYLTCQTRKGSTNVNTNASDTVINVHGSYTNLLYQTDGTGIYPNVLVDNNNLRTQNVSFMFGSGNTTPTYTDYTLDTDITSSISKISYTTNFASSSEGAKTTYVISGTNNTNSSITISEIGLCKNFYQNTSLQTYAVMLVREVLDTPITVAAGDSFVLTFEWVEG